MVIIIALHILVLITANVCFVFRIAGLILSEVTDAFLSSANSKNP